MPHTINYKTSLVNPLTFEAYKTYNEELVILEKTSGPEQTEERIAFTKLNQQRMKRVEKQFTLLPELKALLKQVKRPWQWLVLAETWCGDGAQLLPAIAAIARASSAISLTILLRDENPELMNTALTNGTLSIPILICIDQTTGERLFTWGPRPAEIQQKVLAFKAANPTSTKEELHHELHLWYARDKGQALQHDLQKLINIAVKKTEPGKKPVNIPV